MSEPEIEKSVRVLEDAGLGVTVVRGKPAVQLRPAEAGPAPPQATPAPPPRDFSLKRLFAESWKNWNAIDAPRLGAALAYYTLLSLAPLVVLVVSLTSFIFKRELIQSGLVEQVRSIVGPTGADIVNSVIRNAKFAAGLTASIISGLVLAFGASGVFLELRDSLNTVWGVKPKYSNEIWALVRARIFAFVMIVGTGLILLFLLLLSAVLSTPAHFFLHIMPGQTWIPIFWSAVISVAAMTVVFALMYKTIPDIYLRWNDVWIGALVTAILFTLGRDLIGLYLATAGIGSPYAASGSLILFLTWVYYSAQIFLFGAEFTHVFAFRHGTYCKPAKPARPRA